MTCLENRTVGLTPMSSQLPFDSGFGFTCASAWTSWPWVTAACRLVRGMTSAWEAHAFAMVVRLYERGLFSWPEWAETLAGQISDAQARGDQDLGDTYYRHWLNALEAVVAAKG